VIIWRRWQKRLSSIAQSASSFYSINLPDLLIDDITLIRSLIHRPVTSVIPDNERCTGRGQQRVDDDGAITVVNSATYCGAHRLRYSQWICNHRELFEAPIDRPIASNTYMTVCLFQAH
jgi:hypothetical protein